MKTIKLFMMAALVLMTAACSSDDNDITTPTPQPVKPEGITITATLAPKNGGDDTRGLSVGTDKIEATWEINEKIAILYEVGDVKKKAEATVTAVDSKTGAATIEFTVDANTIDNTACTLVFPYTAAKGDNTGVKDAATLLAKQTGSITSDFMDVRVGAGTIQITNPGLTVTTQPAAQNAIFQIKAKAPNFSITLNALTVTIDGNEYAVNLADGTGRSEIYIALPPVTDKKVSFLAKDDNGRMFGYSKSGVTFAAGKYYKSELKMEYVFSVAAKKFVSFSQGNLQYQPSTSTSTWKFADHQWDNLSYGCGGSAPSGTMDLFTWGNISSPTTTGTSYDTFSSNLSNTIAQGTTGSDWGYNEISNGGNNNSQWRTLTISEWEYLFKTRTNATSKYGFATVNDIHGIIIVPDGFSDPNKNDGSKTFAGSSTTGWDANIYTKDNWTYMEEAGCVFLPAGGQRNGSSVSGYQIKDSDNNPGTGYYWSASCGGSTGIAYFLDFNGSSLNINTTWTGDANKGYGYSVRLVRDL